MRLLLPEIGVPARFRNDKHTGRRKLHYMPAVDCCADGLDYSTVDMRENDTANLIMRGKGTCAEGRPCGFLDSIFLSKTCFAEKEIYLASAPSTIPSHKSVSPV